MQKEKLGNILMDDNLVCQRNKCIPFQQRCNIMCKVTEICQNTNKKKIGPQRTTINAVIFTVYITLQALKSNTNN